MYIIDDTNVFTSSHLQQLSDFVERDLLSTDVDRCMVSGIVVTHERSDYDGLWSCQINRNSQEEVTSVECLIFLNTFYSLSPSQDGQIEELKKVLAHEYGHHWTLSHLIRNHDFNYLTDRMPPQYYQLRGLEETLYTAFYTDKSESAWYKCDKEMIAEDYKFLFAPHPYNQPHRIVEEAGAHIVDLNLQHPNESVRQFIENMNTLIP